MKKFWLQEAGPEGSRALIGFRDANCAKRALAYMSGQPINGHARNWCRRVSAGTEIRAKNCFGSIMDGLR